LTRTIDALVFETPRLRVREYTANDAAFVFDMYSRRVVIRYLGAAPKPLETIDQALHSIERWRAVSAPNPLLGVWAITLRDSDQPVGTVMLKLIPLSAETLPLPLSEDYEVGWHLHPDHWRHGYATEASLGALRRAFDAGLPEVLALVLPDNEASKRVAGRLGMEYLGRTQRYYGMESELYRALPSGLVHTESVSTDRG
jgi:RimJ/RimL family protein N-acetyltransferase